MIITYKRYSNKLVQRILSKVRVVLTQMEPFHPRISLKYLTTQDEFQIDLKMTNSITISIFSSIFVVIFLFP